MSKKSLTIRIALMLMLLTKSLGAHIQIDSTKVLDLSISNKGLTRLSVEGDKIGDVFVHPQDLSDHLTLHQSGNVFIAGEGIEKPFYLTVITTKGTTQDMRIMVVKKSNDPLLLQFPQKEKKPKGYQVEQWLRDFANGLIGEGFWPIPLKGRMIRSKEFKTLATGSYRNKTHELIVYEVQSEGDHEISLDARSIVRAGEGALFTEKSLKPKGVCKLFIIYPINKRGEAL